MPITHIGDAFFLFKSSNSKHKHSPIALKDILLVPSITKNLLSISKLTTDNLSVEYLGNVCFVKDSLRGQVLLQGLAEKWLYRLLLKSSSSSQLSHSSFLSHMCFNKSLSMLSCCYFNFVVPFRVVTVSQKSCNQTDDSSCKNLVNKAILLHRRFGHLNH